MNLAPDAGQPALAAAVEHNFADLLAWYASFPGGHLDVAADRTVALTRVAFRAVNAVVRADLGPDAADRIAAAVEACRATGLPWRWMVGPASRPGDLETLLAAAGLVRLSDTPGMALDIAAAPPMPPARAPGLVIRRVADDADLDAWAMLQHDGLGLDDAATAAWREAHARPGFGEDVVLRTHLAWLDGRAVASAALFVSAGVAGVYNVCTLPEMRGMGIGRAITAAVVEEGRERGLRVAVLGASAMGEPVYLGMGFREVGRLRSWTLA